jgi:hypothetical protein
MEEHHISTTSFDTIQRRQGQLHERIRLLNLLPSKDGSVGEVHEVMNASGNMDTSISTISSSNGDISPIGIPRCIKPRNIYVYFYTYMIYVYYISYSYIIYI